MKTYVENLVATLTAAGEATVLERDGAVTTGAQLLASTYRYARALDGIGIGRGDLVALHAPNSPDALAVRYAAHLLGAATMYLPALPTPQQVSCARKRCASMAGPGWSWPAASERT